MRFRSLAGGALAALAIAAFQAPAMAAVVPAPAKATSLDSQSMVHDVAKVIIKNPGKTVIVKRPVNRVVVVRPWHPRPHYGRIIAGVALGTIIAAAVTSVPPPPPAPDLCWYWSNPYRTHGYWDYCY